MAQSSLHGKDAFPIPWACPSMAFVRPTGGGRSVCPFAVAEALLHGDAFLSGTQFATLWFPCDRAQIPICLRARGPSGKIKALRHPYPSRVRHAGQSRQETCGGIHAQDPVRHPIPGMACGAKPAGNLRRHPCPRHSRAPSPPGHGMRGKAGRKPAAASMPRTPCATPIPGMTAGQARQETSDGTPPPKALPRAIPSRVWHAGQARQEACDGTHAQGTRTIPFRA